MTATPVAAASYGGAGAWAAAELDAALLGAAGIRAVVAGDAHLHAPLFGGHQVVLLVDPDHRAEAAALLEGGSPGSSDRKVLGR